MVVYITPAEGNGGILQFSTTIARETKKFYECLLFVPDSVDDKFLIEVKDCVCRYTKIKTVNNNDNRIKLLCQQVIDLKPEKVIFLEDSVLMQQMNSILRKKKITTAIVIHDVVYHPANNFTFRKKFVEHLRQQSLNKTINTASCLILLSNNSVRYFQERHPKYKAKTIMFRLGAHIPNIGGTRPGEIENQIKEYLLFFGRIDKYKGIGRLCKAYSSLSQEEQKNTKLVIAGRGTFSEEEQSLIEDNKNIILINRFITDEEMVWLMQHTKAVVVPYIEASQSGVVPIAYHFGKPVISSNLPGLVENIVPNKTGIIFDDAAELKTALEKTCGNSIDIKNSDISSFYEGTYNWENNIRKLLDEVV